MSDLSAITPSRRQDWRALLDEQAAGDLTVTAFCQRQGITEAAFYYWRKKLSAAEAAPTFIRVAPASAGLELALASGHVLRIPAGVDGQRLLGVLTALREAQLC